MRVGMAIIIFVALAGVIEPMFLVFFVANGFSRRLRITRMLF